MSTFIEMPQVNVTAAQSPELYAALLQILDEYCRVDGSLEEAATDTYRTRESTRIVQDYKLPSIGGRICVLTYVFDNMSSTVRTWFCQRSHVIEITSSDCRHPCLVSAMASIPGDWTVEGALESVQRLKYELALKALR